jgi:uncharacterized membrane protein
MSLRRANLLGLLLCAAALACAAWLYPQLPDPVPTHWDAAGRINGYTPKPWGAFLLPLGMLCLWIMFLVLPRIAPKGYRLDTFSGAYAAIQLAVMGMMLLMTLLVLLQAAGKPVQIGRVAPMGVGLLLLVLVLGNYMGKLRKNFFIGIRTPWTLASDEVWARTHRLGGWLLVAAGLICIVGAALDLGIGLLIGAVALALLIPAVYSYLLYRRLEGFDSQDDTHQ